MSDVEIFTLGRVALKDGLLPRQHLPIIMVAYLAHTGSRDREHLAQLFWPNAKNPLNSLSSTLTRVRQEAPDALDVGNLQISTDWKTDASKMLSKLQAGRIDEGLALYHGPFLEGFRLRGVGVELEAWILETRDSIAATVATAAVEHSRALLEAGNHAAAADMAERVVESGGFGPIVLDNLDFLYGLLAGASRLAAQTLRSEATSAGYSLDDVTLIRAEGQPIQPSNDDWFIGRGDELDALAAAAKPGTIVNVYGLGGAGKSALAARFCNQSKDGTDFPGGCHLISLSGEVDTQPPLQDAVLAALQRHRSSDHAASALSELEQPTLVVIDDVVSSASIIEQLDALREHSLLAVIVLSRVRIDAVDIVGFAVRGLSTEASEGLSTAGQLFAQRAGTRVPVSSTTAPIIEQICRRVSGLPLAIELTAAWLRMLPVAEILPLFEDEELLDQPPPGENLSLGLVIRRTWDMLEPDEQIALGNLSVMRGGFTRIAARDVADVRLSQLTRLHDYSLVDADETGRMALHPLIHDFAAQALSQDSERSSAISERHSQYFATMLENSVAEVTGPDQGQVLARIRADHDNIESAWNRLIGFRAWETLAPAVDPLDTYLLRSGQLVEALRMFDTAVSGFDANAALPPAAASLYARLVNNLAWTQMLVGQGDAASKRADQGLQVVPNDDLRTQIALLRTKSAIAGNNERTADALRDYLVARELATELGDERTQALLDEDIGRCHGSLGNLDAAAAAFRQTLDAARSLGDPHMEARSYLLLGATLVHREPSRSLVLLDEGATLASTHGLDHLRAYFRQHRGFAYLELGDTDNAIEQFQSGVEQADELGNQLIKLSNLAGLARAQLRAGNPMQARPKIEESVRIAIRTNVWPPVLGLGIEVADAVLATSEDNLAAQIWTFCNEHPLTLTTDRRQATPEPANGSTQLDQASRLDETCERILELTRRLAP